MSQDDFVKLMIKLVSDLIPFDCRNTFGSWLKTGKLRKRRGGGSKPAEITFKARLGAPESSQPKQL